MLALICAVVSANAQTATENSNAMDNVGIGATVGFTSPLDLNSMFPTNFTFGVVATKDVTPCFGVQLEWTTTLNDNHFGLAKTSFKAMNVGLNGKFNLSNVIGGYIGRPRTFEISLIGGLGWFKGFDGMGNNLSSKTGLDLAFNFGCKKAHSLVITPSIYWLLRNNGSIQFNKHYANIGLMATYIYHFKNSNGTHSFKTYDVGAIIAENECLASRLAQAEKDLQTCIEKKPTVIENRTETIVDNIVTINSNEWIVQFAQGSAELTDGAKNILDKISTNLVVDVVGTASPEGENEFNKMISDKRAAVVADYLKNRGVNVRSWVGKGVQIGKYTNRLAIVTVAQ